MVTREAVLVIVRLEQRIARNDAVRSPVLAVRGVQSENHA
jgi:hypothetical protein